ncbi:SRPBCC family protein [Cohnella sp. AR92]|uniref:SRPBCC family protein n=1 Tax=Cohnella sp. AR92 TaxID=648716 RepID=UPI000F8C4A13|nr:SRPBCC family protein [Cohnella sp. AR92]RUS48960.1 polyketide cyclase [Cohnella sp. AR92]
MTAILGDNEVISSRRFDFPRDIVFQAWTNPEQLARWWGPKGFTNTFQEYDLKPGGNWRFVMHGPNGADYPNHIVFEEILPPERIVLRHLSAPEFQVTAIFDEQEGGTRLTFRQLFKKARDFELMKSMCVEGNEQNFDRLQDLLAEM